MLVLTRKLMGMLFTGDDLCVTVVRLERGQVRLGIEAPREVAVVRAELVPERLATRAKPGPRRRIEPTTSEAPPHPVNPVSSKTHRHRYR
jgi:carbon storage regulator